MSVIVGTHLCLLTVDLSPKAIMWTTYKLYVTLAGKCFAPAARGLNFFIVVHVTDNLIYLPVY